MTPLIVFILLKSCKNTTNLPIDAKKTEIVINGPRPENHGFILAAIKSVNNLLQSITIFSEEKII